MTSLDARARYTVFEAFDELLHLGRRIKARVLVPYDAAILPDVFMTIEGFTHGDPNDWVGLWVCNATEAGALKRFMDAPVDFKALESEWDTVLEYLDSEPFAKVLVLAFEAYFEMLKNGLPGVDFLHPEGEPVGSQS